MKNKVIGQSFRYWIFLIPFRLFIVKPPYWVSFKKDRFSDFSWSMLPFQKISKNSFISENCRFLDNWYKISHIFVKIVPLKLSYNLSFGSFYPMLNRYLKKFHSCKLQEYLKNYRAFLLNCKEIVYQKLLRFRPNRFSKKLFRSRPSRFRLFDTF